MKNAPAFQFYARDWIADTFVRSLSDTEYRVYFDLLSYCWEADGLPTDQQRLARLVQRPLDEFAQIWDVLSQKFTRVVLEDGREVLYNLRLLEQRDFQAEKRRKSQDAAKKSLSSPNHPNNRKRAEKPVSKKSANAASKNSANAGANAPATRAATRDAVAVATAVGEEVEVEESQTETPAARPRDELFDALVEVYAFDVSNPDNAAIIGKLKKASREKFKPPLTPAEILDFGDIYAVQHPNAVVPDWKLFEKQVGMVRNERARSMALARNPRLSLRTNAPAESRPAANGTPEKRALDPRLRRDWVRQLHEAEAAGKLEEAAELRELLADTVEKEVLG